MKSRTQTVYEACQNISIYEFCCWDIKQQIQNESGIEVFIYLVSDTLCALLKKNKIKFIKKERNGPYNKICNIYGVNK